MVRTNRKQVSKSKPTVSNTGDPEWSLADCFTGPDDPRIERALTGAARRAKRFGSRYRGRLTEIGSASELRRALEEYEQILETIRLPVIYASLRYAETAADPARGAFFQAMQSRTLPIHQELLFFELELPGVDRKQLEQFRKSEELKPYANYLRNVLRLKKHLLSETEERLLQDTSLSGRRAFVRLYSEERSLRRYPFGAGKRAKELSEAEILKLLYDPRRETRQRAAESFSRGLREDARRLSFIFNTLLLDKRRDDERRRFRSPEDARHLANEVERRDVDVMTDAVVGRYGLVQDYYRFKRKHLGLGELWDFDRYAPLGGSSKRVPFEQAKRWVLEAFGRFSPEYGRLAAQFFEKRWIDAALRPGKRGGAFCSFGVPSHHPYVLLNYTGTIRDVFTLAHELGHGVHACLMGRQTLLGFDPPLTVAETASVFAEMLLFDYLREQITDRREQFVLHAGKVEDTFATVFRQVSMHRFEQDIHAAAARQGEIPVETFNQLWRNRQSEMFGKSVRLSENYDLWWSYIPHFVHTPFYVYAYAFGELLTLALYAQYKQGRPGFVGKYMDLLAAGSTKAPGDLVRPFGLSLKQASFWEGGLDLIAELERTTKTLAKEK